jgi:hypothetical protein
VKVGDLVIVRKGYGTADGTLLAGDACLITRKYGSQFVGVLVLRTGMEENRTLVVDRFRLLEPTHDT